MKVFISWSGTRSNAVASELGPWIKKLIPSVEYFLSSEMERGVKWLAVIGKNLDEHSIGILCVTPGNVRSPWVNFEAGALSKQIGDEGRIIPYLLAFKSPSDLKDPLGQFNASTADEAGTWEVVKTLDKHSEHPRDEPVLRELFDAFWPKLGERLTEIEQSVTHQPETRRTVDDKVDELLQLTRQILREPRTNIMVEEGGRLSVSGLNDGVPVLTAEQYDKYNVDRIVRDILQNQGLNPGAITVRYTGSGAIDLHLSASIHISVPLMIRDRLISVFPEAKITYSGDLGGGRVTETPEPIQDLPQPPR